MSQQYLLKKLIFLYFYLVSQKLEPTLLKLNFHIKNILPLMGLNILALLTLLILNSTILQQFHILQNQSKRLKYLRKIHTSAFLWQIWHFHQLFSLISNFHILYLQDSISLTFILQGSYWRILKINHNLKLQK